MTEDLREHLAPPATWGGNVSGPLAEDLHAAAKLIADNEPCPFTVLSFYENRIVKCWVTGWHRGHRGLEFNGEVREWQ